MTKQNPEETPAERKARLAQAALERARRDKQVIELRLGGATYQQITEQVASVPNPGNAYRIVQKHLADIPREAATELREVELARYDEIQVRLMTRLRQGDLGVVDQLLRLSDRRVRLTGLLQVEPEAPFGDLKAALGGFLMDAIAKDQAREADAAEAARREALGPDADQVTGLESD